MLRHSSRTLVSTFQSGEGIAVNEWCKMALSTFVFLSIYGEWIIDEGKLRVVVSVIARFSPGNPLCARGGWRAKRTTVEARRRKHSLI